MKLSKVKVKAKPSLKKILRLAESPFDKPLLRGGVEGESWVFLIAPGHIVIEGKSVNLDAAYLRKVSKETNRALADAKARAPKGTTPWTFPVLRDHQTIGRREGDILETRFASAKGLRGLWALVRWLPETFEEIKAKKVTHVSLGINPEWTDERGSFYGPLLWELSITAHPRAKSIGALQDTLAIQMSETTGDNAMDFETFLIAIQELLDQQRNALKEDMTAMLAAKAEEAPVEASDELEDAEAVEAMEEEEEAVEAMEDEEDSEKKELSERLVRLERLLAGKFTGLNFAEKSSGGKKPTGLKRTPITLAEVKAKHNLSGKAAIDKWISLGGRA